MKKKFRYKKFLIIFGAVIVFFAAVFFAVRAIFPLPPEREMVVTENRILIDTIEYLGIYYGPSTYFTPYDDESLMLAVAFDYDEDSEFDAYTRLYRVYKTGKYMSTRIDYVADGIYAFEDGNFGVSYHTGEDYDDRVYFLRVYNSDFEFVSEKTFPEKLGTINRMVYSQGSFYGLSGRGFIVFDRDMNITAEFDESVPDRQALWYCTDADNNQYYYLTQTNPDEEYFSTYYYIRPMNSDSDVKIDVPEESLFAVYGEFTPRPGDSEYPFYATYVSDYGYWSILFDDDLGGRYICGLNTDGSITTLMPYDGDLAYNFYGSEPMGDKRYFIDGVSTKLEYDISGYELYLCEYTVTYEE
jgi:hypothetical protein